MHEEKCRGDRRYCLQIRSEFLVLEYGFTYRLLLSLKINMVDLATKALCLVMTGVRVTLVVPFSLIPTFEQDAISQCFMLIIGRIYLFIFITIHI